MKDGFILTEVLVVTALLALLATVILSALTGPAVQGRTAVGFAAITPQQSAN